MRWGRDKDNDSRATAWGQAGVYGALWRGMSGSPVYIDGRLVGALSYRIGQFQ